MGNSLLPGTLPVNIHNRQRDNCQAAECKASKAPSLGRGKYSAINTIKPDHVYVVAPVDKGWPMGKGIDVVSVDELIKSLHGLES